MKTAEKTKVLVIAPSLVGGGWISLDEPLKNIANKFRFIVAGLGPAEHEMRWATLYRIPYFDHRKVGLTVSVSSLFSVLYELPLILTAFLLMVIYRPKIVVGVGFCSSLSVVPLAKIMNKKIVVSHHGMFEYYCGETTKKIVKILGKFVDEVFVNSEGSKEDVSPLINSNKVKIIKHWAHDVFFSIKNDDRLILKKKMGLSNKFVLLYVGKIDREKLASVLVDVINKLSNYGDFDDFCFIFIGTGGLVRKIKDLKKKYTNVKYFSYIGDRAKLSNFYSIADLVWSYGDITYLARPAVEALASGVPVMIPDVPAALRKMEQNMRIRHDLVPKDVGWVVDTYDIDGISKLILRIKREKKVNTTMRDRCRAYAKKEHSMKNTEIFTDALTKLSSI